MHLPMMCDCMGVTLVNTFGVLCFRLPIAEIGAWERVDGGFGLDYLVLHQ